MAAARRAALLLLLLLLANTYVQLAATASAANPSPEEVREEISRLLERLQKQVIGYHEALEALTGFQRCAAESGREALALVSGAAASTVKEILERGASTALIVKLLGILDTALNNTRNVFLNNPVPVFPACNASTLYKFLAIVASNPTSIGFVVNKERIYMLGVPRSSNSVEEALVELLVVAARNAGRADKEYWSIAGRVLAAAGGKGYCRFFAVIDARDAPMPLVLRAARSIVDGNPWNPLAYYSASIRYSLRMKSGGEGGLEALYCRAAVVNLAVKIHGNSTRALHPLYRAMYIYYQVLSLRTGETVKRILLRVEGVRDVMRESVLWRNIVYRPGPSEYPYTLAYLVVAAMDSIARSPNLYNALIYVLASPMAIDSLRSRGEKLYPDPIALSFAALHSGLPQYTVEGSNAFFDENYARLVVDAVTEPGNTGELVELIGYYSLLGLEKSSSMYTFTPLLFATLSFPTLVVDPDTASTVLEYRTPALINATDVWSVTVTVTATSQDIRVVDASIGVDTFIVERFVEEPVGDPLDTITRLLVNHFNNTWRLYGRYYSLELSPAELRFIENTTGVSSPEDSLRLLQEILAGRVKPASLEEIGLLARAASIRSLDGSPVYIPFLARIVAFRLLNETGYVEAAMAALGLASPDNLNDTLRWAAGLTRGVIPPWAPEAQALERTGNDTRLVDEASLLEEIEELASNTTDPVLSKLLRDYYDALARGDYAEAERLAEEIRAYLRENYEKLGPETVEALARITSINVTDKGLVIDLNRYSETISWITGQLERAASSGSGAGNESARGFLEKLAQAIQERAVKELGERVVEIIKLRGGEELVKALTRIASAGNESRIGEEVKTLGGLLLGSPGPLAPLIPLQAPLGVRASPPLLEPTTLAAALLASLLLSITVAGVVMATRKGLLQQLLLSLEARRLAKTVPSTGRPSRAAVVTVFSHLLNLYSRLFAKRERSETHREYAEKLPETIREAYREAALAYEEAKFSSHVVGETHLEKIRRAFEEALKRARRA